FTTEHIRKPNENMKQKVSKRLLFSALLSLSYFAFSQDRPPGTIRGVLTDSQGAAVPAQKIVIRAATAEEDAKTAYTITNLDGAFEFRGLPFGTYFLESSIPGFEGGFKKRVNITAKDPVANDVQFIMEPCGDVDAGEPTTVTDKEKGEMVRQMLVVYLP